MPTAKLKLNLPIARNVSLLRCPPNFMLMPVEANPPNLIPYGIIIMDIKIICRVVCQVLLIS